MDVLYRLMIDEAQACQKFKSLNGRDILDFPLHIPMGIDIVDFLDDAFEKYYLILEHMKKLHGAQAVNVDIDCIKDLGSVPIWNRRKDYEEYCNLC